MSRSAAPDLKKKKKTTASHSQSTQTPSQDLLDTVGGVWLNFRRFGSDILGVVLFATALLILLGLSGLTEGMFVTPAAGIIRRLFGWGSFPLAAVFGLTGVFLLLRRTPSLPAPGLARILALEMWAFCILALLAIAGGRSPVRAERGLDGGLVGWGLTEVVEIFVPLPLATLVWVVLFVVFSILGFGFLLPGLKRAAVHLGLRRAADAPVQALPAALQPTRQTGDPNQALMKARVSKLEPQKLPLRDERLPPLTLLMPEHSQQPDEVNIHMTAALLEKTLAEFGIPSRVVGFRVGPSVTQFAVEPGYIEKVAPDGTQARQKVRVSQISALSRDIALALSAARLRIEAPVPGHSFVGIEVPNVHSTLVRLRPILETEAFHSLGSPLSVAMGKDVSGQPVVGDLARMPHLLVAGTTGSGKSVCIAALAVCLVMNNSPSELRLALLDPKMVELIRFNGMPHLLGKVETKPERMLGVLRWALVEMDQRYRKMEAERARDFDAYNKKMSRRQRATLPRVVIMIDELADLMMSAPDQTEQSLVRLAQMARATGIHLVVATQRPSTDVVTGLIKANFPARISFTVASSVDSRVILDANGAETLLGRGDMLFLDPEAGKPIRCQGVMVTDHEIDRIVAYWKRESPGDVQPAPWEDLLSEVDHTGDALIEQAVAVVQQAQRASASLLQRRLRVGYPRAARLIDELEEMGVVGPAQGGGREREVLWHSSDDDSGDEGDIQ